MPGLQVAGDHDLPELAELVNLAYRGEAARQGWTHEADLLQGPRTTADELRRGLAQNPQARLLLWREGEGEPPFACVWLEPSGPGTWYLGMLTVRPEIQAQGLGRRLLAEAEAHAVAAGARRIRMTVVNLREPLIAWYERRGYARTGDTLAFPYGDPTVGAPLRPDLGLVVLEKPL